MKIAVVGSRTMWDYAYLSEVLGARLRPGDVVVSGDCPEGADALAKRWAAENGFTYEGLPAAWVVNGRYNREAGFERNHDVVDAVHGVIAFWDGISAGTLDTIKIARQQAKPRVVFPATAPKDGLDFE